MISFADYERHDALALASLVATGNIHPRELIETAIARIEEVNPKLNAVVHKLYDRARAEAARELPGGLSAEFRSSSRTCSPCWKGPATPTAAVCTSGTSRRGTARSSGRQRAAGLVIVGKTNTPELGILPVTEPALHGATATPGASRTRPADRAAVRRPRWLRRSCRWSHGGDGGGSIRNPRGLLRLVRVKPTRGRNPLGPFVGEGRAVPGRFA